MQRFVNSSISIRRNRFRETGSKFESVLINNIDIGKSLNSINCKEQYYTNFVNTINQKVYILIEDFYSKIFNNKKNIFNDFLFDELYYNGKSIDRLLDIINKSNNSNYDINDLTNIYKLKNNKEPNIHLYIQIIDDSALVLLIDLYHLSIPGDLYSKSRLVKRITLRDLPGIYKKFENYNHSLSSILINNKESELVS